MRFRTVLVAAIVLAGNAAVLKADITLTEGENHAVRVEIDGKFFTEYRYEPGFFPILYPIVGPNGETVTRHFPMKEGVEGEASDHEHHRSLAFVLGDVNGYNFWAPQVKKNDHITEIVHDRFEKIESGEKRGDLVVWTKWMGDGKLIAKERKRLGFIPTGNGEVLVDYDIELHALDEPITIGDTDDSGLNLRVAGTMKVRGHQRHGGSEGKGTILNSRGDRDDDAWGKRAEWVDYFGPDASGNVAGITVMDHPSNYRYPTGWHARYYGLLSTGRWGITSFERKTAGAEKGDGNYTIPANGVMRLRHRFYFHRGNTEEANVAERFASYAGDQRFHPKEPQAGPRFVYKGAFLSDTTIFGEQKQDWVQPSHPYCWQLSRDRWIWVFQTRGFSGIDAERSILYQIRRDKPDGPIVTENLMQNFRDDWDPHGDGSKHWKIHGHPKVFGVPRGAIDKHLNPIAHDNLFVAAWYTRARGVTDGKLLDPHADETLANTLQLEWIHFQLNEAGDDIEFLEEPAPLRQLGFETGEQFCALPGARIMNHWAHTPEPLDDNFSSWIDTSHFNNNGIAAIEYRYDAGSHRYQWVRTGTLQKPEPGKGKMFEGSLNRIGDEWILCVRNRGHVLEGKRGSCTAWFRTDDPFTGFGKPAYAPVPSSYCPRVAWQMPDGVLRIFSGDILLSPHRQKRDPLFCWDVNPDDFSVSNQRTILDAKQVLGMHQPMVGFAKLSPVHNNRQILTFRVTTLNHREPDERFPEPVSEHDLAQSGAHHCVIIYPPGTVENTWNFE